MESELLSPLFFVIISLMTGAIMKQAKGEAEFIQTIPREEEEGETNVLMKRKRTHSE